MKKRICALLAFFAVCALLVLPVSATETQPSDKGINSPEFSSMVEEENTPVVYVDSAKGSVGDLITVSFSLGNVEGFTSGSFAIQYNPYMLQYEGFEASGTIRGANVYYVATEDTGAGKTDLAGNIAHDVRIGLLHLSEFPATLSTCDVGTITFRAIGGGTGDLEVTAMDFAVNSQEVEPRVNVGVVEIEGETASTWDYDAITTTLVSVGSDNPYHVQSADGIPTAAKIAIVIAIVAVIVLVVLLIARGKNYSDEEEQENEPQKAKEEEPVKDAADAPTEAPAETQAEEEKTEDPSPSDQKE